MRADADDLACVRDPALERLLIHTATLGDGWRSRAPDPGDLLVAENTDRCPRTRRWLTGRRVTYRRIWTLQ
jgi:hypothetical protein